jgi:hypothetical protein
LKETNRRFGGVSATCGVEETGRDKEGEKKKFPVFFIPLTVNSVNLDCIIFQGCLRRRKGKLRCRWAIIALFAVVVLPWEVADECQGERRVD